MSGPLRVLSLGAGVQSSTLLLMAAKGELGIHHWVLKRLAHDA